MIKIVNARYYRGKGEWVDRRSVLGNPFKMRFEEERDYVCSKYEDWLLSNLKKGNIEIINEMKRLFEILMKNGELVLICWCAPKRCHAESIKMILEFKKKKFIKKSNTPLRGLKLD